MSPLPDPYAQQAVASPLPPHFLSRLLGTETGDAFALRANHVVGQLSARFERPVEPWPEVPSRLGSYFLGPRLGRGGMGSVYRGVHETTGKVVALKMAPTGTAVGKFLHAEALALGGLDHRGVVQIFDHGEEQGLVWLAMQMVRGETLHAKLQARRSKTAANGKIAPLTRAETRTYLGWFRDLTIALAAIHERGVVHRDIKPANLMIAEDGTPYVIDFGLSLEGADRTVVDTLAGTVPYMSPEQVLALTELDGRTDIYSLAVCFYELLSGQRVVREDDKQTGLLRQVAFSDIKALSAVAPWVPGELDSVFAKALAKDPAQRYPDATQLATDLAEVLAGRSATHASEPWTAPLRRRSRILVPALLVLCAAGFFGWRAWNQRAETERRNAAQQAQIETRERARVAELQAWNKAREQATLLGDAGADAALDVLTRALIMLPDRRDSEQFKRDYTGAVKDLSGVLTKAMFRRTPLIPSKAVDRTFVGRVGAMAKQHLSLAGALPEKTQTELVVQAMFADLLARRYEDALAMRERVSELKDGRVLALGAVAGTLARKKDADPEALKLIRTATFANLDVDEMCCQGFLMLQLIGTPAAPKRDDLAGLAKDLRALLGEERNAGEARNFLAGLLALTLLRLEDPSAALIELDGRLRDGVTGPEQETRVVMLMLAAAAGLRSSAENAASVYPMDRVVEAFKEGAASAPEMIVRFVKEVVRSSRVEGNALPRAAADFFDELMRQKPSAHLFTESMLDLMGRAAIGWCGRPGNDCLSLLLVEGDWQTLLEAADLLARVPTAPVLDLEKDRDDNHRQFWINAIHTAGNAQFLSGPQRTRNLERCRTYRDAAVRSLAAPNSEFDLVLASVKLVADPTDKEAWTRYEQLRDALKARLADEGPQGMAAGVRAVLKDELETVALIEGKLTKPQ